MKSSYVSMSEKALGKRMRCGDHPSLVVNNYNNFARYPQIVLDNVRSRNIKYIMGQQLEEMGVPFGMAYTWLNHMVLWLTVESFEYQLIDGELVIVDSFDVDLTA